MRSRARSSRLRSALTALAVAGAIAFGGCGGGEDQKAEPSRPAESYFAALPAGYSYEKLPPDQESELRSTVTQGNSELQAAVKEVRARRVLKEGELAGAALVMRLDTEANAEGAVRGFTERLGSEPKTVTLDGKQAQSVTGQGLSGIVDTDGPVFIAVLGNGADLSEVAAPIVR